MIKKALTIVVLCVFIFNLIFAQFALVYSQEQDKKPRIAVLPFTDTNAAAKTEGFGEAIAGMLMTELINGKVFQVIERSEIDRIIKEMSLQISGMVDSKTAKQLGEILGVDILVFGNSAKFDRLVETDIRLIDTQSGEALLAEHASSQSGVEIRNMVESLARKIENRYLGRFVEKVTIASNPDAATVYIDGVMEGVTPLTKNLGQGMHKIRIVKENYNIWEQTIVVIKGENTISAALDLSPQYYEMLAKQKKLEEERQQRLTEQERLAEQKRLEEERKRQLEEEKARQEQLTPPKKGGSKTLLYVLGGAAVVGGGVAAMMLMGGNGDGGSKKGSIKINW